MDDQDKGDSIQCYLCYRDDFWVKYARSQEEENPWFGSSSGEELPPNWCHDYHDEGNTIYFCCKVHKDLYKRAKFLSWQAVALLKEFAKSLKTKL